MIAEHCYLCGMVTLGEIYAPELDIVYPMCPTCQHMDLVYLSHGECYLPPKQEPEVMH